MRGVPCGSHDAFQVSSSHSLIVCVRHAGHIHLHISHTLSVFHPRFVFHAVSCVRTGTQTPTHTQTHDIHIHTV